MNTQAKPEIDPLMYAETLQKWVSEIDKEVLRHFIEEELKSVLRLTALKFYNAGINEALGGNRPTEDYFHAMHKEHAA